MKERLILVPEPRVILSARLPGNSITSWTQIACTLLSCVNRITPVSYWTLFMLRPGSSLVQDLTNFTVSPTLTCKQLSRLLLTDPEPNCAFLLVISEHGYISHNSDWLAILGMSLKSIF